MKRWCLLFASLTLSASLLFAIGACKDAGNVAPGPPKGTTPASFSVSASFGSGAAIPQDHSCDGADQNPQLAWTSVPDKTKSIAIVVDDPDASAGTFTHWILWNIKPDTRQLGAGGNGGLAGGIGGTNDFGRSGYAGPCPPKGALHHYHFKIYALDAMLTGLKATDKRADLDKAMNGHVLGLGELVGTFQH